MKKTFEIHGFVSLGFEPVVQLFKKNFENGIEEEAQLCVYLKDKVVVNLWGVSTNKSSRKLLRSGTNVGTQYNDDSLTCVFSCSKVLTAICFGTLVEKRLLSYDDKVIKHWPEYGNNDEEKMVMTIADILRHEGGLPKFSKTLSLVDIQGENIKRNAIGEVIEKEKLRFPPEVFGSKTQYHMYTMGFVLNEIFRRVDPERRTIGEYLRQNISTPLGAAAYIGLTREELKNPTVLFFRSPKQVFWGCFRPKCMGKKVQCSLNDIVQRIRKVKKLKQNGDSVPVMENMKQPTLQTLLTSYLYSPMKTGEIPSTNGQASGKGLAKIAAMMANKGEMDGIRFLSESTWDLLHSDFKHSNMFPHNGTTNFSVGGVNLFDTVPHPYEFFKSNEQRKGFVGWMGFGGSTMQWHPELKIGFGYVPTLLAWEDASNNKAALLQRVVVNCLMNGSTETSPVSIINHAFTKE